MEKTSEERAGEVDLWQLARTVWEGRWIVIVTVIVATMAAIAMALTATPVYRSEALVQPRQETISSGALGNLAVQLGSFADLAGLPGAAGADRAVVVATLKSRTIIESYIQDSNLLPKLYESLWDSDANAWKIKDPTKVPTVWQAYNRFMKSILSVTDDRKTGLCTVAVEWKDPVEAQRWVSELIGRTNEYLKTKAIQEGERNLAYLEQQARKIGQVELQQALYGLVEAELRKLMIAKGGEEFAIKTIDQAVVPTDRIRPKRTMMVLVGGILGGVLGVMLVLARQSWLRRAGDKV